MRINLYGEITEESARDFVQALEAMQPGESLELHINSNGGSVIGGLAIFDAIANKDGEKTAIIEGICASAATYAALACNTVKMQANATFMIHKAEAGLYGTLEDIENDLQFFRELQNKILNIYAARTGKTPEELYNEMPRPVYMTAEQAKAAGYVDIIIGAEEPASPVNPENSEHKSGILYTLKNLANMVGGIIKRPEEPAAEITAAKNEARAAQNALETAQNELADARRALAAQAEQNAAELAAEREKHAAALEAARKLTEEEYSHRVANALAGLGLDPAGLPAAGEPKKATNDGLKLIAENGLAAFTSGTFNA